MCSAIGDDGKFTGWPPNKNPGYAVVTVYVFEMKAVIDHLASSKYPGLDELSAEQSKFAHAILSALMSTHVSCIVVHGHFATIYE